MYVDESGDCGLGKTGASQFFILSGVVVHELRWSQTMQRLIQFRHWLKGRYGIYLDDELHASDLISKPSKLPASLARLRKHERLSVLRCFTNEIADLSDINIINVMIDKNTGRITDKDEVFRWAWYSLFQRLENTIRHQNFPGPKNADDQGLIFPDDTDGNKLRKYLAKMRLSNRLKVRQQRGAFVYKDEPIRSIIEDPVMRRSHESYLVQVADCAAYLLKQKVYPCGYMKRHGGNAYFNRLDPVLCKHACNKDPQGIVRL